MKNTIIFAAAFAALFIVSGSTIVSAGDAPEKTAALFTVSGGSVVPVETTPAATNLYEQLGGEAAVKAAVDGFYDKVLADDRVNGFFKGVDMDRQRAMQTAFLTVAFGGPNHYEGKDLRAAHARLVASGLNDTHFDIIIGHLGTTLKELGVKDELIQKVADVANSVRPDVLGK